MADVGIDEARRELALHCRQTKLAITDTIGRVGPLLYSRTDKMPSGPLSIRAAPNQGFNKAPEHLRSCNAMHYRSRG